jgi:LuxR family maltose regulon positive regulatory protein
MLPLHRLRARGQITEIHAQDLRFTVEEAALFLNQTMGLHLSSTDIAVLEQRTEGWITGLQLAALSMRDVADAGAFVAAFAGDDRYVVDYLITETLDNQPQPIQDFLLKTAILRRFTASLCDAVTEQTTSRDILIQLERANLFLVPLDSKREWYRYHRLFRDLLCYRLREKVRTERIKQMHQRAATWYIQNELVDEAIYHSLAAEDFEQATRFTDLICADLVEQSQFRKLLHLVAALPEDLVRTYPRLCVYHAWTLGATGELDAVMPRLADAEQALSAVPPTQARVIRGQIATLRAYDARHQHDLAVAIEFLHQALQYLPPDRLRERILTNGNLGVNYLTLGQLDRAREALQTARTEGRASGRAQTWMAIGAISYLADTYVVEGQLGQATQLYQEAIAQGMDRTGERLLPTAGHACVGLGRVLYERGEIDEARRHLRQAIELSEMIGFWGTVLKALIPLAWLEQMQGNNTVVETLLQQALDIAKRIRHSWANGWVNAYLSAYQARIWLMQKKPNLAAVARWAETYQQSEPDATNYPEELGQLTLSRIELAMGQSDQALTRLRPLAEADAAGQRNDSLIKILVLQALAQATQGAGVQAVDTLNRALDLAAPEGYCQTFLDKGPAIIQLLRQSHHPYAAQLLYREASLARKVAVPSPVSGLEEALNEREIKVLRLFAAGLSNAETAQEMFLSTNTIKWYAKNIYRKLNVNRRAQAVAKARELGLIP